MNAEVEVVEEANVVGRDVSVRARSKSSIGRVARHGIVNHKGCHENGK